MSNSPNGVGHTDSIDSRDPDDSKPSEKKKSRRPANTAFRQQRLKAWQPILTPKTVLPLFFGIGIIFAPIGGLLLYASSEVQELRIDYTNCALDAPEGPSDFGTMDEDLITKAFKGSDESVEAQWRTWPKQNVTPDAGHGQEYETDICELQFRIPEDMGPPVLFYYHLTNFYQNHRQYVESFYDTQLKGGAQSASSVKSSKCSPIDVDEGTGLPIYPCGLIANSMFNDTFSSLEKRNTDSNTPEMYEMDNSTDIAWNSDRDLYEKTEYKPDEAMPPPYWRKVYPDGYTDEHPPPNIKDWEAFQVWMRTAGLPEFSKLYQRNNNDPLTAGTYRINITDNFPTREYKGTKSIIISTRTVMGGRNSFLGIAYVVVGGVCILLGGIFTITHLLKPRKLGDHTYLSWNNTPANKQAAQGGQVAGSGAAMASGRDVRNAEA